MVHQLSEQLSFSNEIVTKLKRENSQLETQLLKVEYENTQLRNSNMIAEMRHQGDRKNISNTSFNHSNKVSRVNVEKDRSQAEISISHERGHDRETTSKKMSYHNEFLER
jgi:hypothetical protein